MRYWIALFFIFVWTFHAYGASFDCAKARSETEKVICSNAELGALDEKLGETYRELRNKFSPEFFKNVVKPSQLNWLKNLSQCTKTNQKSGSKSVDEKCLIKDFSTRNIELKESLIPKYGYFVFNGRVDSKESIFQKRGSFQIISKEIFLLDSSFIDDSSVDQKGRVSCYYDFELISKSRNRNLEFGEIFIESKKKELTSLIKVETFKRIPKPDSFELERITEENIKERLSSLKFEKFNSSTFLLSQWAAHENCAIDVPFIELPTILLRPYLTKYAKAELGL